jgi:hypothetical protein
MPHITLSVPKPVYEKMRKYPEIKWSEIARRAIAESVKKIEEAQMREHGLSRLLEGSEDADELFEF